MRDFKGMKRQRGRNRGGGGTGGGGGGKPQQNANRAFDSNGPDNIKVRGHAQHVFEKYQQLARDATSSGDRVLAENFLQHAEHYFRVLRTLQPNRPIAEFVARDSFSGYDIDFEDESGAQALPDETPMDGQGEGQAEAGEQPRGDYPSRDSRDQREGRWENRQNGGQNNGQNNGQNGQNNGQRDGRDRDRNRFDRDRPRDDRGYAAEGQTGETREARDDRSRDDRSRDDRPRDDRPREDRSRDDRSREDRPREDRLREDRPREDRPREDRAREERPRDERPREDRPANRERAPREERTGEDRPPRRERSYEPRGERADPLAVIEPKAQPLTAEAPTPAPTADEGTSVLRSRDGETSHAPAFLQAAPAPAPSGEDTPVKRPRGRPRKVKDPAAEEV